MSERIYHHVPDFDMERILKQLASDDNASICEAILCTALHSGDYKFTVKIILDHIYSDNESIKNYAIIALGHLARIHQTLPDTIAAVEIIEDALNNISSRLTAIDAADYIHLFVPDIGKRIQSPLLSLAVLDNNTKEFQYRLNRCDRLDEKNLFSETALHHAAYYERIRVLKILLMAGCTVDVKDNNGHTPLMHAAKKGNIEIVKILLLYEADANLKNEEGRSAIHLSCICDKILVLKLFIQNLGLNAVDLDNNYSDYQGNVLHIAASYGYLEILEYLITLGMDINKRGNVPEDDWTPLQYACLDGNVNSVKILLQAGSDLSIYDNEDESPINLARNENHLEIVSILQNWAILQQSNEKVL